ncbi:MAG: DUF4445 domain-containing protein [Christensenellaceae bacterium]|nr:DUF4445 domain-containing protein [Christensenellaceae bacterium]
MPQLTIQRGNKHAVIEYHGEPILDAVLAQHGYTVEKPCGGRGTCGKCVVEVSGDISQPNPTELSAGVRLACQTILKGNAEVILPEQKEARIQTDGISAETELQPMKGKYGAAIDIGTTTVVLKLYDLRNGKCISEASCINPQRSTAADVMGRIDAAMKGALGQLQQDITNAVSGLLKESCTDIPDASVSSLVITGNTTMLYLLCGKDPASLSRAPFIADTLFGESIDLFDAEGYLPPCMNAFVGADITCAVLASGMCDSEKPVLLCDIGTNGEIALWKNGTLYTTSTAAGPAFEGAGISCGCGSIVGAIDRVSIENHELCIHTIGDAPAAGLCGSGLIDAISAFLELELIDETGAVDDDELPLDNGIFLLPKDIRAVQLAKAAIAAGIDTILEAAETSYDEICTFYIAGGFGSHLNIESAAAIGLIPELLAGKVKVIGNAALSGAAQILLHTPSVKRAQEIAKSSVHVNLGGNPKFNERYMDNMFFGDLF